MRPRSDLNQIIRDNRIADYRSVGTALGMLPLEFSPGRSLWSWREQPSGAINAFGAISGGYLAVFIDEVMITAIASVLEDGEWAVTAELKLSFIRPVTPGLLNATAQVLRRGRGTAFLEARIETDSAKLAVSASSTWAISRADSARASD